ncbi:MAG: type II toxin-antitoxin system Phd/YefM family antitoxin [Syntrophomonadaceae bacterium]|jgi:prevent-host-death family protein|nr:type II toxin-antitoxin system Phd/YefM family antitoxin [Syntrophomonadaceae bacterium]
MLDILKNPFVGVHELRKNLTKLLSSVKEDGAEVVITQQGKPVALLVDIEKYLEVKQALKEFSDAEYLAGLLEARKEIKDGKGIPAEEVFSKKVL